MTDWATERAAMLWSLDTWQDDLAEELRKAKADGLRQAAEIAEVEQLDQAVKREPENERMESWQVYNQGVFIAGKIERAIRTQADKIEKGET